MVRGTGRGRLGTLSCPTTATTAPPTCLMGMARPLPATSPRLSRLRFSESLPRRVCGETEDGVGGTCGGGTGGATSPTTAALLGGHPGVPTFPHCQTPIVETPWVPCVSPISTLPGGAP